MSWKSTITITRHDAIITIMNCIDKTPFDEMTNEELEKVMYRMGFGDESCLPYFGHNFTIVNDEQ